MFGLKKTAKQAFIIGKGFNNEKLWELSLETRHFVPILIKLVS